MSKTAMQELFEKIHSETFGLIEAWEWLIDNKEAFIEKEKQQIIDAWKDGLEDGLFGIISTLTPEQYYNETYK